MDLAEQVHIFGLTNMHTFGLNISLIRLFSLMLNYAKPRIFRNFEYYNLLISSKLEVRERRKFKMSSSALFSKTVTPIVYVLIQISQNETQTHRHRHVECTR